MVTVKCLLMLLATIPAGCSQAIESETTSTIDYGPKPSWTPDSKTLILSLWIEDNYEICSVSVVGKQFARLTTNERYDGSVSVSPDGKSIAFESLQGNNRVINLMDLETRKTRELTVIGTEDPHPRSPTWVPDNHAVTVVRTKNGKPYISTLKLDGSSLTALSPSLADADAPTYSRNGNYLAFRCQQELLVVDTLKTEASPLVIAQGTVKWPSLSPDGKSVAYVVYEGGGSAIYVRQLGEGGHRLLTQPAGKKAWYWHPEWSPKGDYLAFNENVNGKWGISVIKADGSSNVRLRENDKWEGHPVWSPDSRYLAFFSDQKRALFVIEIATRTVTRVR